MSPLSMQAIEQASRSIVIFFVRELVFCTLLFIPVILISRLLKGKSPHWQFGLWILVLIRLIIPPGFSSPYSGRHLLNRWSLVQQAEKIVGHLTSVDQEAGYSIDGEELLFRHNVDGVSAGIGGRFPVFTAVVVLWFCGLLITSILYRRRMTFYVDAIKKAGIVTDPELVDLVSHWRRRFNIRRRVQLVSSDFYLSPFTIGVFRPIIFIPHFVIEPENSSHVLSMIAHEMAHIKRMDYLWIRIENIVLLLYFFFPPVWICKSRLNQARELMCDRMVLSTKSVSVETYGRSILSILQLNLYGRIPSSVLPGFTGHKKVIHNRLKSLKGDHHMSKLKAVSILLSCLLGGLFILPMSETEISAGETKPELITTANAAKDRSITLDSPLKTGHVSASYGPILDPFTKEKRFHKGIDIAAPKRTDVLVAAAGIVDSVRIEHIPGQGPGKLVIISHEHGLTTKYTQLDTIYVEKGQSVDKGQIIAGVGSSGRSTGPHLHFELLENGENVNPADYIDFSPLMKKRD